MLKTEKPKEIKAKKERHSLGRNPLKDDMYNPKILEQTQDVFAKLRYFRPNYEEKLPEQPHSVDMAAVERNVLRGIMEDLSEDEVHQFLESSPPAVAEPIRYIPSPETEGFTDMPIESLGLEKETNPLEQRIEELAEENKRLASERESAVNLAELNATMAERSNEALTKVLVQRTNLEQELELKSRKIMAKQGSFALSNLERAYAQKTRNLEENEKTAKELAIDQRVIELLKQANEVANNKLNYANTLLSGFKMKFYAIDKIYGRAKQVLKEVVSERHESNNRISHLEHALSRINIKYNDAKKRLKSVYAHYGEQLDEIRALKIQHKAELKKIKRKAYTFGAIAGTATIALIAGMTGLYSSNTSLKAENDALRAMQASKPSQEIRQVRQSYNSLKAQREIGSVGLYGSKVRINLNGPNLAMLESQGHVLQANIRINNKIYKPIFRKGIAEVELDYVVLKSDVTMVAVKDMTNMNLNAANGYIASQTEGIRFDDDYYDDEDSLRNLEHKITQADNIVPTPAKEKKQDKEMRGKGYIAGKQDNNHNLRHANRQYAQRNHAMKAYLR